MQFLSLARGQAPAASGFHIPRAFVWIFVLGLISASGTARAAEKPRLQVNDYQIDAELTPATHHLKAHAVVKFTALDDLNTAVFELHNALHPTRIVDASGRTLNFERVSQDSTIRVPLPEMSRERRQEFVKTANKLAEEGRVHVRNVRHGALDSVKKAKLPEDETKRLEKDIQTATDKSIAEINSHLAHKEKELLTV